MHRRNGVNSAGLAGSGQRLQGLRGNLPWLPRFQCSLTPRVFFQNTNQKYIELLEGLDSLQQKCLGDIKHQRYRIGQIIMSLKQWVDFYLRCTCPLRTLNYRSMGKLTISVQSASRWTDACKSRSGTYQPAAGVYHVVDCVAGGRFQIHFGRLLNGIGLIIRRHWLEQPSATGRAQSAPDKIAPTPIISCPCWRSNVCIMQRNELHRNQRSIRIPLRRKVAGKQQVSRRWWTLTTCWYASTPIVGSLRWLFADSHWGNCRWNFSVMDLPRASGKHWLEGVILGMNEAE